MCFVCSQGAPQQVIISGASGNNAAFVNGSFLCVDELYNGRALYQKVGDPNAWLRYLKDSYWAVTAGKVVNNNNCYAHSVNMGMAFATGDGKLVEQKAVRVSPAV